MKVIFILSFVFLTACSASKSVVSVDYNPIIPDMPPKPSLPITSLSMNSDPAEVMKAYVATVMIQKSYIDEVNDMISFVQSY